ncbi:MAG: protein phosphatase 2C domain-containing protein [Thiohalocapsa sp.]|uniref:PP2C family protein-serine/threonine phosphatase n=1 Tax=Thiohalocapsa sp. TaxID=2497641 RepID=UPI0025DAADB4|nr:protein phosphatase 2C domain-containing protein [Thiohalocapsa sp.]MCG6940087.1 protein phosphatase 2C domain-containing protein [Thiohalocapsa sp.]
MTKPPLEFAWRSDRGRVRARNEDSVVCVPESGIVVVADGIGGASAGDVASDTAARVVSERFARQPPPVDEPRRAQLLAEAAINEANGAIVDLSRNRAGCAGMGTTVVMGYFGCDWLVYAHVGDSRLYRLRDRELAQLTRDHSFIQEVVDQGFFPSLEEAREYGINENVLTRAVGSAPYVVAATAVTDLAIGDIYLFCTDGLSGMVAHEDLRAVLAAAKGGLGIVADALVHYAIENGGSDNITLALVRVNAVSHIAPEASASAGADD